MPKPIKYYALMEHLRTDITNGKYPVGGHIPSENTLAADFSVSRQTVRQALALLENEGYITKRQGSSSIVSSTIPLAQQNRDVAVITTYIGEYIFPNLLRGVEEILRASDYSPVIMATRNRMDNERSILQDILSRPVAGLIIEGTKTSLPNPNIALYNELYARKVPIVFAHSYYPVLNPPVYVIADDKGGGYEAVRFLKAKGHRHIAGIFKSDDMQGIQRYSGYVDALNDFDLPISDDYILWYNTPSKKALKPSRVLEVISGCTALVCYNDEIAVQVLDILKTAAIQVPSDLAVISFDNSTYGSLTTVKITSMAYDEKKLGRIAAQKLLGLMRNEPQQPSILPWTVVEKEST